MRLSRIVVYLMLILLAFFYILPFWTVFTTAFKDDLEVRLTIPIVPPSRLTIDPLMRATSAMSRGMFNSLVFTSLATLFSSIIGSINGYVLSKIRFKHSDKVFFLLTLGIFIPYHAVIIPLVVVASRMGIYDSLLGMTLVHTVYGIPICTLLFRNFYEDIPESIINAAKIDGASFQRIFLNIVLPLSLPAFVVTAVFQFTSIWNDFLFGLILTRGLNQPASVVLANLLGTTSAEWNVQMAGTIIYALPSLLVYLLLGKYLVRGYLSGALKG